MQPEIAAINGKDASSDRFIVRETICLAGSLASRDFFFLTRKRLASKPAKRQARILLTQQ
jgi:hypothetical protein